MAFFGSQLCSSGRCVMVAMRRNLVSVVKPAVKSTCLPLRAALLCEFGHAKPFAARSYYLLSKYSSKPLACSCGTCNGMHTKGDKELVDFLTEEIAAETKSQKSPRLPKIEGFEVVTDGSAITFSRKFNNENIKVLLNVNHTVDADLGEGEINPSQDKATDAGEMKSKPNFSVEIEKDGKTLEFGCSIVQQGFSPEDVNPDTEAYDDVFNIDEVTIFEKERTEKIYAVSGEIMDGYLYDLLMNYLEERGISNDFAEKLIDFATSYEHKQYIGLLEKVKAFISSK